MFLAIPIVLGAWIFLGIFLSYPIVIGMHIKNEGMVLEQGLEGDAEYKKRIKYRLLPFIW